MHKLHIEATENTPEFFYDVENFTITISGNSKIDKSDSFYPSITQALDKVEAAKPMRLNLEISFSSLCRNSKRGLLFFLMRLKEIQINCKTDLRVSWHYHETNQLVKLIGEDLEYMVHISINLNEIKNTVKPELELADSF